MLCKLKNLENITNESAMVENLYTESFRIFGLPRKKLTIFPEVPKNCHTYGTERSWDCWRVKIFVVGPELSICLIKKGSQKILFASDPYFANFLTESLLMEKWKYQGKILKFTIHG